MLGDSARSKPKRNWRKRPRRLNRTDMPRAYPPEATEDCFQLYLRYNGGQHDRIEQEMRRKWPMWSKQNLYTRGQGANQKIGWIEKYGWERGLKLKLATNGEAAATSAEALYLEIESTRKRIKAALDAADVTDRDLIYQHRDFCKLSVDALARLEAARDNLDGFVAFWERLLTWLPEISKEAALALLAVNDEILARAEREYGG